MQVFDKIVQSQINSKLDRWSKIEYDFKYCFLFMKSGLEDQLLTLVAMQERPDLEEQRNTIVVSVAQMKQEVKENEDRILYKLSSMEGSPLDDLDFIITLEASKTKNDDIKVSFEYEQIHII